MRSTLPLFPTDDGWPYPEAPIVDVPEPDFDFDALELIGPHVYDCLTVAEHHALFRHFGLDGQPPLSMKELAAVMGCTRAEAREFVGGAIAKLRMELLRE